MKKIIIYTLIYILPFCNMLAQQAVAPASKQTQDYTIVGATAHLGTGKVIQQSVLLFSNGKITFIGDATTVKIPYKGKIIQAKGKHIYPGFIAVNTSLGLAEIDAVRATRDFEEVGTYNPHIRSIIAYNAESRVTETMRPNGVLIAQITPRGGTISGTSSVVQLDAWNWEDALIKKDDAIHINWSTASSYNGKPDKYYTENLSTFKTYINKAKVYLKGNRIPKNLPFDAMEGLFNGATKLFIHVNGEREITDAINLTKELGIKELVIVHGNGAEKVSELLKKHHIPVVLDRAHQLPNYEDEDIDLPYRTAKILTDKGITVAIGMEGVIERMSTRNIPFYTGTYAAYGLGKEKALQLITTNAAKVLGINKQLGTLETGKDATFFISEGDALDMKTNQLTHAFINGRKISLETHQTKLWKRYNNKYNN